MTFNHGEVPPCILRDITNIPASHTTSLNRPINSSDSHFLQQFGASHPLGIGQSSLSQMGSSHAAELRNVSLASLQQPASSTLMRAAEHFAPSTVTVGSRFLTDAHSTSVITAPVPTNSAIADNTVHTINSAFAETTPMSGLCPSNPGRYACSV